MYREREIERERAIVLFSVSTAWRFGQTRKGLSALCYVIIQYYVPYYVIVYDSVAYHIICHMLHAIWYIM